MKIKIYQLKNYFDEIRPYLSDIINEHKNKDKWKIQINMSINFISSKDSDEARTMHAKSDNADIMTGVDTNDVIEKLFKSTLEIYFRGGVSLHFTVLMSCIISFIRWI